jgi:three-Cys-motif partner protein
MGTTDDFFDEQKEQSAIKTAIVANFYSTYLKIISNSVGRSYDCLYYIDLFAGPGKYEDGKISTPLKILDVIKDNKLEYKVHCLFNEMNNEFYQQLKMNLREHSIYNEIEKNLLLYNVEAKNVPLDMMLNKHCPVFSFIDPFGYKSVSANQIWKLIKNVGSDCILFFNANRILLDLNKSYSAEDMDMLYGDKLQEVRNGIPLLRSHNAKIRFLLKMFCKNLYDKKSNPYHLYTLPFQFDFADRNRGSHYLLFITKSYKAIEVMKDIMNKFSNYLGDELGFDPKTVNQIALDLSDDYVSLKSKLLNFIDVSKSWNRVWKVKKLMADMDEWHMREYFTVTPYPIRDLRQCLRNMSDSGDRIRIINYTKLSGNEIFSDKREFQFINKSGASTYV